MVQSSSIRRKNSDEKILNVTPPSDLSSKNTISRSKCQETCYVSQKAFVFVTFLLLAASCFSMLVIWEVLTQDCTDYLYENIVAKQEWLSLNDRMQSMIERTEIIHDVVADR